ncbi:hypothetical protein AAVH_36715, partial [Aphelenchoides avenae]
RRLHGGVGNSAGERHPASDAPQRRRPRPHAFPRQLQSATPKVSSHADSHRSSYRASRRRSCGPHCASLLPLRRYRTLLNQSSELTKSSTETLRVTEPLLGQRRVSNGVHRLPGKDPDQRSLQEGPRTALPRVRIHSSRKRRDQGQRRLRHLLAREEGLQQQREQCGRGHCPAM